MFSNAYKYFLAVTQNASFHKAAQELFVSQPAISKQIKHLEDELGYPLLIRTTRTVSLTPEGKVLYAALLECEATFERAKEEITRFRSGKELRGTLRLGTFSNWALDQFDLPYVTSFFQEHAGVELFLIRSSAEDLIKKLSENDLDVMIMPGRELETVPQINQVSLGHYPFLLLLSKEHPLAQYDDIIDRLDGVNLYTHLTNAHIVGSRLAKRGMHPNIVVTANVDSKIAASENGLGCAIVLPCSQAASSPKLKAYPIPELFSEIMAAYKTGNTDPLIRAFIDHVNSLQGKAAKEI